MMECSQLSKPSRQRKILPLLFFILAVILLATAVVTLFACHQNISLQLEQGVPVEGNELAIINLYLSSCVQYFALSAAMMFCGYALQKITVFKSELPAEARAQLLNEPTDVSEPVSTVALDPEEEDDTDFEGWGFRRRE